MNWIDIVIIVYLIISVISGAAQGLIRSVLSLLGIIIGVVLAANFYKQLGGVFGFINNDTIAKVIAFLIIVGVVMIVASIIGSALKAVIKAVKLGWVDGLGGAFFGVVMGAISASALLAVIVKLTGTQLIADSKLSAFFLDKFPLVLGFLPDEFNVIRDFFQ